MNEFMKNFSLEGKIAFVTGASYGIGFAIASAYAAAGATIVFNDINQELVNKGLAAYEEKGIKAHGYVCDVTDEEAVQKTVAKIRKEVGIIDILVNNAGIDTQPSAPPEVSGPFENFPEEVFREVVDVNLVGTFLCCQAVGARMVAAGKGGSIINIGSIYGMLSPIQDIYAYKKERTGIPFIKPVAYSAAKSGIYNLTRYLATYWGKSGIRVNTLTPAGVWRNTQDETFIKNFTERMPMGRMSQENEYNGSLIFLASQASSFMTGSNLVVDGGWTAW